MKMTESGLMLPDKQKDKSKVEVKNEELNLLPSEENDIYRCIVDEKNSFECHQSFKSVENLNDFKKAVFGFSDRLTKRIAEKGFVAIVSVDYTDPENLDIYEDDSIEWHPTVDIVDRTDKSKTGGHDLDKKMWEARHGFADGKPGRFIGGNIWTDEPDAKKTFGFGD